MPATINSMHDFYILYDSHRKKCNIQLQVCTFCVNIHDDFQVRFVYILFRAMKYHKNHQKKLFKSAI